MRDLSLLLPAVLLLSSCPQPGPPRPEPTESRCAQGWVEVEEGLACDAVLPDQECPAGFMPRLGLAQCQPVGTTSCPEGTRADRDGWGCQDVLPATPCSGARREVIGQIECQPVGDCERPLDPAATIFVDVSYAASQLDATHFASIAAAVTRAPAGAVIAVESGTYVEALRLTGAVTVAGRCAEQVILQAPVDSGITGVEVLGGQSELRGLTLRGHFNGAIVRSGATLQLRQVVVTGNAISGLRAIGGTLVVSGSVVRDSLANASGRFGYGVFVEQGGSLQMETSSVVGNRQAGVVIQDGGTQAALDGVVVTDTFPAGDGSFGMGVVISGGPSAELNHCVLARNSESGLYVDSQLATQPTQVTMRDSVLRDTLPRAVGVVRPGGYVEYFGRNLMVQGYATVDLHNSSIRRASGAAVVSALGSVVRLHDSIVFDTEVFPNGDSTTCAAVQQTGVLELERSALGRGAGNGVVLYDANSRLQLVDSLITDIRRSGTTRDGNGLVLGGQAEASLDRSAIIGCAGIAVIAGRSVVDNQPAGHLTLEGAVIARGRGYVDGSFGRGLDLGGGLTAEISHSAIVFNREVAVVVREPGTVVNMAASVVRDTQTDGNRSFGRGINVQSGGALLLTDCLLARNREVSLFVGQADSHAELTGCTIVDSLPREVDGQLGWGLGAIESGRLDLVATRIARSASLGLVFAAARGTVSKGEILDNAVGLHVQDGSTVREQEAVPGTLGPLEVVVTTDTVFERNGTRLGSGVVPLPDLLSP
ncbi:MAG: right-handed parallel beta-helix repeat-containing protein [Pseudomonadota bacterium]